MIKVITCKRLSTLLLALIILILNNPLKAQNYWTPNSKPFDDYMTMSGYLVQDGKELKGAQYEIACFIDNDCRGSYRLRKMDYLNHPYPCFLAIWGSPDDNGKEMHLLIYDHEAREVFVVNEVLSYQYGESIGVDELYVFSVGEVAVYVVEVLPAANGKVYANKVNALEDDEIELTVFPDDGYELELISAYKKEDDSVIVPLSEAGERFTFSMPGYNVVISAAFKKTQFTLDKDAIEAALKILERAVFTFKQSEASSGGEIIRQLVEQINKLLEGTGFVITASDIRLLDFIPAIAGTEGNPRGNDGSFEFSVTLGKGDAEGTTDPIPGTITATSYEIVRMENVEFPTLKAFVSFDGVLLMGLIPDGEIIIYDLHGRRLFSEKAEADAQYIPLSSRGIYIVTNVTRKIKVIF